RAAVQEPHQRRSRAGRRPPRRPGQRSDLLHRREISTDRHARAGSWWLRLLSKDRSASEYVESHARQARDVMTHDVVSVAPDTSVAEIAALLETRRIKRVPVLRGAEVVGIVSRADLVQALAE